MYFSFMVARPLVNMTLSMMAPCPMVHKTGVKGQLDIFPIFSDPARDPYWKSPEENDNRKHACYLCDKRFTAKTSLERHYRIHTGKKDFICPICEKAFSRRDALNQHMIYHGDEKMNSCSVCSKGYKTKQSLKLHIFNAHPELAEEMILNKTSGQSE